MTRNGHFPRPAETHPYELVFGEVGMIMYLMITFTILGLLLAKPVATAVATLDKIMKKKVLC